MNSKPPMGDGIPIPNHPNQPNQSMPPIPGVPGMASAPPPNINGGEREVEESRFEEPQETPTEFQDGSIEDIFGDYEGQPQYQEDSQDSGNEGGGYNNPTPSLMNSNIMTVAGIIGLIVVMFFVVKLSLGKYHKFRDNREYNAKMNSTVTNSFYDFTGQEDDEHDLEIDSPKEPKQKDNGTVGEVITQISKYKRSLSADGRTVLNLDIEGYGAYDIYIPRQRYNELENNGYIIVDLEVVDNKVNYIFISNKQENFKDILEGK